jgi:DNA polymerase-3 subunit chi
MTQVDFHTHVADKFGYTCRLVRKAWRSGHRLVVTGAPEQLSRLDGQLWTFDPGDFIPHARLRAGQAIPPRLAHTPVWLADAPAEAGETDVLVNLGPGPVPGYQRWARVVEIVAESADEVASGRQRWRQYLAAGVTPNNHSQIAT